MGEIIPFPLSSPLALHRQWVEQNTSVLKAELMASVDAMYEAGYADALARWAPVAAVPCPECLSPDEKQAWQSLLRTSYWQGYTAALRRMR